MGVVSVHSGCSWQRIKDAINPEKVRRHRGQYLTLFNSLKQVLRLTKRHKPALAIELPKSCQYWQHDVVQCLIREHQLVGAFCDGCMLGVTDQHGIPICKSWRIACTFPIVALQDKICDGNHMHGESRGQALKIAESYTFSMTDAIHREFARHVAEPQKLTGNLFACLLLCRPERSVADFSQLPPRRSPQGPSAADYIEDGIG